MTRQDEIQFIDDAIDQMELALLALEAAEKGEIRFDPAWQKKIDRMVRLEDIPLRIWMPGP